MADQLIPKSDGAAIYERVVFLVGSGKTLKAACVVVSDETGKKWQAIKMQYHRCGGNKKRKHGRCKLTIKQEGILLSVIITFSVMHEALTMAETKNIIKKRWNIDVGGAWVSSFQKRNKDELSARVTKMLTTQRAS